MCSVDKTGCEAIITQRALVFLSAVASRFRSCGGSAENFVVMLLNDAFHVIHTAVANFNCVFVENFVVPMVFIYIYIYPIMVIAGWAHCIILCISQYINVLCFWLIVCGQYLYK